VRHAPPRTRTSRKRPKRFPETEGPAFGRAFLLSVPASLRDDLHPFAELEFAIALEPVEHEETLERMIGHRHALGELLHRIAEADAHHRDPQRPHSLRLVYADA